MARDVVLRALRARHAVAHVVGVRAIGAPCVRRVEVVIEAGTDALDQARQYYASGESAPSPKDVPISALLT